MQRDLVTIAPSAAALDLPTSRLRAGAAVILPVSARRPAQASPDVQSWTCCSALPVLGRMFARPFPSGDAALAVAEFAGALELVRDGGTALLRHFELDRGDRALLERCLGRARAEGAIVLFACGERADRSPLRAIGTLRAQAARHRRPGAAEPAGGLADLLRRLAVTRAVVLAVRDWQWVDDASRRCLLDALTDDDPARVLCLVSSSLVETASALTPSAAGAGGR